jgi:hypothetical protein
MPRKSPEAKAAMYWHTKGKPLEPPADMDAAVKRVWRVIASSRPPDFFNAGSAPLLEAYCETIVMLRFYRTMWRDDRTNPDYLKAIVALNSSLAQLSTKLRLSISSIDKRSGILDEKEPVEPDNVLRWTFSGDPNQADGSGRRRS